MNSSSPFYITNIQNDRVLIESLDSDLKQPDESLGALQSLRKTSLWYIPLESKANLPALLNKLRDKGLPFLDEPKGWPPAAIFAKLVKEGKILGGCLVITFSGPGTYEIKDAKI
jgi:hypothetical protein